MHTYLVLIYIYLLNCDSECKLRPLLLNRKNKKPCMVLFNVFRVREGESQLESPFGRGRKTKSSQPQDTLLINMFCAPNLIPHTRENGLRKRENTPILLFHHGRSLLSGNRHAGSQTTNRWVNCVSASPGAARRAWVGACMRVAVSVCIKQVASGN